MDISKFELVDGVWIAICVHSDVLTEPFRFKVQPLGEAATLASTRAEAAVTALFIAAVVDWDFTNDGQPLPCDEANKKRYLTRFATYLVASVNGKPTDGKSNMASEVMQFCLRPDNFLKN